MVAVAVGASWCPGGGGSGVEIGRGGSCIGGGIRTELNCCGITGGGGATAAVCRTELLGWEGEGDGGTGGGCIRLFIMFACWFIKPLVVGDGSGVIIAFWDLV